MKCFTLRPLTRFPTGASPHGPAAVTDRYPTARAGINLNDKHALNLVWKAEVPASEELLKLSADGDHVVREGRNVSVLRASVDRRDGVAVLVPEREDDRESALILCSVGASPGIYLTHEADQELVVAHGINDDGRFGRDEELLVKLKPWQSVKAVRRTRKWVFWGEVRHIETLTIRFDGRHVFYDVNPPKRRGYVD